MSHMGAGTGGVATGTGDKFGGISNKLLRRLLVSRVGIENKRDWEGFGDMGCGVVIMEGYGVKVTKG